MRIEYDSKSKQLRTITKDSTNRLRFEIHIDALSNSYVYQSSSRRMKQRFLNVLVMFFARFLNVLNPKMEQNRRTACQWCASDIFIVLAHHWQACAAFRRLTPRPANDAQVVGTMSQAHHWQAFRWSWMRKRRPANDAQVTISVCFAHHWHAFGWFRDIFLQREACWWCASITISEERRWLGGRDPTKREPCAYASGTW